MENASVPPSSALSRSQPSAPVMRTRCRMRLPFVDQLSSSLRRPSAFALHLHLFSLPAGARTTTTRTRPTTRASPPVRYSGTSPPSPLRWPSRRKQPHRPSTSTPSSHKYRKRRKNLLQRRPPRPRRTRGLLRMQPGGGLEGRRAAVRGEAKRMRQARRRRSWAFSVRSSCRLCPSTAVTSSRSSSRSALAR